MTPHRPASESACTCRAHIPEGLWRAYYERRISLATFAEIIIEHLCSECPVCAAARKAAQQPHDYGAIFARFVDEQGALIKRVEAEHAAAPGELDELLALPLGDRLGRIERARTRFRSPVLADLLLDRSFEALPGDPDTSLHFALLADAIVTLNPCRGSGSAKVRALAHKGNALRARGRLSEARRSLTRARDLLYSGVPVAGNVPEFPVATELYALVDSYLGSYYKTVRDFPSAESCLNRAALLYASAGDRNALHRTTLTLADLYIKTDHYEAALKTIAHVLTVLSEEDDPPLYWNARFNHALCLAETHLYDEARDELAQCADFFDGDEFWRRRILWTGGRVDLGLAELDSAARSLQTVRRAYLADGSGFDMALVSLDLGVVYLKQGRTRQVKRLAEEMSLIFEAQDVHREAIAALLLFQEAARQEAVTLRQLLKLRHYLEAARSNPELVFEPPS